MSEAQPNRSYPENVLSVDIRFPCAECGKKLQIDIHAAGNRVNCVHCKTRITVPEIPKCVSELVWDGPDAGPAPKGGLFLTEEEIAFLTQEEVKSGPRRPVPDAKIGGVGGSQPLAEPNPVHRTSSHARKANVAASRHVSILRNISGHLRPSAGREISMF